MHKENGRCAERGVHFLIQAAIFFPRLTKYPAVVSENLRRKLCRVSPVPVGTQSINRSEWNINETVWKNSLAKYIQIGYNLVTNKDNEKQTS